ncbi:hypothetical protein [Planctomonas psychrotolerans]|uniref:hypothetical protein n=1 Tax=Planctomonas psychrotolerans TaxID=2528712 RepID=UPI00123BB577|nr:hypothetical protein [Planctomonas psychrotolerans]
MSGNVAHAVPRTGWIGSRTDAVREQARRHIEIVSTRDQRKARPRTVYALLIVGALFAVLMSQLLLSIGLSDGAYAIQGLQQQQRELSRTQQVLTEDLERLSSPQNLAANAQALGMVSNAAPVYLRLSDRAVLGAPVAATADAGAAPLVGNVLLSGVAVAAAGSAAEQSATDDTAASTPPVTGADGIPVTGMGSGAAATDADGVPESGLPTPITR